MFSLLEYGLNSLGFLFIFFIVYLATKLIESHIKMSKNRIIWAPQNIPIIGNFHTIMSFHFYQNLRKVFLKFKGPLRFKFLTYQTFMIDSPEDIQKLILTERPDLYDSIAYHDGLFSIEGIYFVYFV